MKPCKPNRKLIALSALGELDEAQQTILLAHLEHCEGCRVYFDEISQLARTLSNKSPSSRIQADEVFHHTLLGKLRTSRQRRNLPELLRSWWQPVANWKVALPALGAAALGIIALLALHRPPVVRLGPGIKSENHPTQRNTVDIAPTISNYQMVANQSFDRLDELLTKQGTRNLPPTPIYTASARVMRPAE